MNEELTKSLTDLIDETLMELEELKKSRFSAAEIKIEGPGDGIAGKPSDGKLDAAKAEDKKDEDEKDEDEAKKAEDKDPEGDPADAPEVGRKLKELTEKAEKEDKKEDKKDDDNKDEKKEDAKGGDKHEAEEKKAIGKLADLAGMKKSEEELSSLMKSYIDERVKPLEDKLSSIFEMVHKIAEQPVAAKGATARTVPLMKSADEGTAEPLSKTEVAAKLFDLKKSGSFVDSLDVTKAEMGQDLTNIVKKYKLS